MPHTSHVEDAEAKHELNLGLCGVKLANKCLSLDRPGRELMSWLKKHCQQCESRTESEE